MRLGRDDVAVPVVFDETAWVVRIRRIDREHLPRDIRVRDVYARVGDAYANAFAADAERPCSGRVHLVDVPFISREWRVGSSELVGRETNREVRFDVFHQGI